ncbi:hypothetical protein [Pseudomonas chlororaphis]|uniref:Lipoprotein n=1 Tax=Pseudomonas chlororaphis TaxID=587753 RepID=A0A1Q8ERI9_9PSED|nr:hypothetical protein [Pseudomonas chlororaphis]OLF54411.1 hypothetical protein BTN82_10385 [Pseudomonas chlororaphis]
MHGSGFRLIALCFGLAGLAGCSGLGSNTLVFGTDTKVALDVSGDPAGQPSFTLGYKRRETIWLPLSSGNWGSPTHLCIMDSSGKLLCESVAKEPTRGSHVCVEMQDASKANAYTSGNQPLLCDSSANVRGHLYQGTSADNAQTDAYSVMASFGLDTYGGDRTGAKVAQFIATGIAARNLTSKSVAPLINPESATLGVSQEAVAKTSKSQSEYLANIASYLLVSDKADKARLDALGAKIKLSPGSQTLFSSYAGQTEAQLKLSLKTEFSSDLEKMDKALEVEG